MYGLRIVVVGSAGAVGTEMIKTLERSKIPIRELIPADTEENEGKPVVFRGREYRTIETVPEVFRGTDIALFSAGAEASAELAPIAVEEGAVVIDNSAQWRMDPTVPLVVPEVNIEAVQRHRGIIANPNCSTIQMLLVLGPLHRYYEVKRVVVSTYQAVSGSGLKAIEELKRQSIAFLQGEIDEAERHSVYPHRIAFNALPHIDVFMEEGYTKEEMKMVKETHKILDPKIRVCPTAVRIPVFRGHSEALNIEVENSFTIEEVVNILSTASGVKVVDDPTKAIYPIASEAEGKDNVFVGRIRRDPTLMHGLNLWVVSDNLRKGAALNAVQIAEALYNRMLTPAT
ncbi:MAG: aspartate-semialdehyde dehydrogenase [Spirochaetes bacterium]|nr:MAG: aspartate-semialdehyde dehydrogenase [Spirochaetota bacterium]